MAGLELLDQAPLPPITTIFILLVADDCYCYICCTRSSSWPMSFRYATGRSCIYDQAYRFMYGAISGELNVLHMMPVDARSHCCIPSAVGASIRHDPPLASLTTNSRWYCLLLVRYTWQPAATRHATRRSRVMPASSASVCCAGYTVVHSSATTMYRPPDSIPLLFTMLHVCFPIQPAAQ